MILYFPGCEVTEADEKLRLLKQDDDVITVNTALTRVMSKYYNELIPEHVATYYTNILLDIAGDDIDNDKVSLQDVLNRYFDHDCSKEATDIERQWVEESGNKSSLSRIERNTMTIFAEEMSYAGYNLRKIFGCDILKDRFDDYMARYNEYVSDTVMDYLLEAGYEDEYNKYYETHVRQDISDEDEQGPNM